MLKNYEVAGYEQELTQFNSPKEMSQLIFIYWMLTKISRLLFTWKKMHKAVQNIKNIQTRRVFYLFYV